MKNTVYLVGILFLIPSCTKDKVCIKPDSNADTNIHYSNTVKPIIDNYCISCHDQTASIPLATKNNVKVLIQSGQLLNAVSSPIGQETPYLHMPPNSNLPQVYIDSLTLWQTDSFPN